MKKANRIRDRGSVEFRHEADAKLERPGDFVLVLRGVLRSIVLRCPDDCGDILTINLDSRAAKAWRFYRKHNQVSLFPSVWRDTGCRSHFIVWHHVIQWCDWGYDNDEILIDDEENIRRKILEQSNDQWQHFSDIAEVIDAIPWDVNRSCGALSNLGQMEAGEKELRGYFKLPAPREH